MVKYNIREILPLASRITCRENVPCGELLKSCHSGHSSRASLGLSAQYMLAMRNGIVKFTAGAYHYLIHVLILFGTGLELPRSVIHDGRNPLTHISKKKTFIGQLYGVIAGKLAISSPTEDAGSPCAGLRISIPTHGTSEGAPVPYVQLVVQQNRDYGIECSVAFNRSFGALIRSKR